MQRSGTDEWGTSISTMSRRCILTSMGPNAGCVKCVRCPSFLTYQFRKKTQTRRKQKGELVFSNIQGPSEVPRLHGARYALTFIDDFSRYAVVHFVVRKSDTLECFKEYVVRYGAPTELRTDKGGEYTSTAFKNYCKSVGLHQELTVPGTPQQSGVAEILNRVSVEMARSLLLVGKLGKQVWVRAMATIRGLFRYQTKIRSC